MKSWNWHQQQQPADWLLLVGMLSPHPTSDLTAFIPPTPVLRTAETSGHWHESSDTTWDLRAGVWCCDIKYFLNHCLVSCLLSVYIFACELNIIFTGNGVRLGLLLTTPSSLWSFTSGESLWGVEARQDNIPIKCQSQTLLQQHSDTNLQNFQTWQIKSDSSLSQRAPALTLLSLE